MKTYRTLPHRISATLLLLPTIALFSCQQSIDKNQGYSIQSSEQLTKCKEVDTTYTYTREAIHDSTTTDLSKRDILVRSWSLFQKYGKEKGIHYGVLVREREDNNGNWWKDQIDGELRLVISTNDKNIVAYFNRKEVANMYYDKRLISSNVNIENCEKTTFESIPPALGFSPSAGCIGST